MEEELQDQLTDTILQIVHSEQNFSPSQRPCFGSREPHSIHQGTVEGLLLSFWTSAFSSVNWGGRLEEMSSEVHPCSCLLWPSFWTQIVAGTRSPQGVRTVRSQAP